MTHCSRYYNTHVCRTRAQPELPARRAAARVLPRRRQGQETHPRQPVEVARRSGRGVPHPAQGRGRAALPRRRLRHPPLPAPRPRRRRAGNRPPPRPREAPGPPPLARPGPGHRHDPRPHPGSPLQAGHRPLPVPRDPDPHAGRGTRRRGRRRERPLPRHGLAAQAPGPHRAPPGGPAPRRGRPGALRRHLGLLRGLEVSAGQARLLPRRQARQAPDRLRAAVQTARAARSPRRSSRATPPIPARWPPSWRSCANASPCRASSWSATGGC